MGSSIERKPPKMTLHGYVIGFYSLVRILCFKQESSVVLIYLGPTKTTLFD